MASTSPVSALAGIRLGIGAGAWATPNLAGRLFGLDPVGNPQTTYLARLFGARDIALGAGALTTEGESRRRWLQYGMACDVADAAAGYLAGRAGILPKPAAVLCTGVALAAVAMGAAALAAEGQAAPAPVPA